MTGSPEVSRSGTTGTRDTDLARSGRRGRRWRWRDLGARLGGGFD